MDSTDVRAINAAIRRERYVYAKTADDRTVRIIAARTRHGETRGRELQTGVWTVITAWDEQR